MILLSVFSASLFRLSSLLSRFISNNYLWLNFIIVLFSLSRYKKSKNVFFWFFSLYNLRTLDSDVIAYMLLFSVTELSFSLQGSSCQSTWLTLQSRLAVTVGLQGCVEASLILTADNSETYLSHLYEIAFGTDNGTSIEIRSVYLFYSACINYHSS